MNVLFFIGNGFDKAQGLNTSYQDFYKFLKTQKSKSQLEERIKSEIRSDYETWADLEVGLGKYSAEFTDADTFLDVLNIMNGRLKEYLIQENNKLASLVLSRQKLVGDLCYPDGELEEKQRSLYRSFVKAHQGDMSVDCVSLNYTNTLEHILGGHTRVFLNNLNIGRDTAYLNNLIHLHGTLDEMILLGVNDVSQISNVSFRNNTNIIENFVKPEINNGCENMRNERVSDLIKNAHLIVLFGVSIGLTDQQWWDAMGTRLEDSDFRLIYYPYNVKKDVVATPNYKLRWAKEYIGFIKERMGSALSVEGLREKVYVGINKPFLNLVDNSAKPSAPHPLDKLS